MDHTMNMECCEMKGFLSYLILWILSKNSLNGAEIGRELEKRRGTMPSPGTIYPALKELKNKGLIKVDANKYYSLTHQGEEELKLGCEFFCQIFYDMKEMSDFSG
jgi:PadR family transcriptional regulator, regulatory protein PadR